MTKEDLLQICTLVRNSYSKSLEFRKYSPLFNREVSFLIFFEDYEREEVELTDAIMNTVNFFLSMDKTHLTWMKPLCYQHFEQNAADSTYGNRTLELMTKHNKNCLTANQELFGVYNEEQALAAVKLNNVCIDQGQECIYLTIEFEVPWDEEHGMRFLFVNNEFTEVE